MERVFIPPMVETICEDDATRQEAIVDVIKLFEQAREAKQDLVKQYAEYKDISPERHTMIVKILNDEAWKDYEVKATLWKFWKRRQRVRARSTMEAIEATATSETLELELDADKNKNSIDPTDNDPSSSSIISQKDVIRAVEIVERDSIAIAES
ncbi:hypothetical protein Tco_1514200, partial [Tanacetum coccineum]